MRLNIVFRHSITAVLGAILVCSFAFSSVGRAQDSFWEAATVDWWVANGSEKSSQCQIHWLFDDEIDVYFQRSHKGYFYFGFDDGDTKLFSTRSKEFESYLVVNSKEYQLSVEKVNGSVYVAPLPAVFNDLKDIRDAEVLLLVLGNSIYHFPLENSDENFEVYKTCIEDNNEIRVAVKEPEIDLTPPVAAEPAPEEKVEVSPPVAMDNDPNLSQVAEVLAPPVQPEAEILSAPVEASKKVSAMPVEPAENALFAPQTTRSDYLVPSRVSDVAEIERSKITDGKPLNIAPLGEDKAGNVSRWDDDKEDLAAYFTEENTPDHNQYDERVSKAPQINRSETIDSVIKSLETTESPAEELAQSEEEIPEAPVDDLNPVVEPKIEDGQNNEVVDVNPTQDVLESDIAEEVADIEPPQVIEPSQVEETKQDITENKPELNITPEAVTEVEPQPAPAVEEPEDLPDIEQAASESGISARLAALKQADSTKRALESMETSSDIIDEKIEDKLAGCGPEKETDSSPSPNYGSKTSLIINNLTRKLSVLEKEKESLRKKLLAVNEDPVLSEIVACNTQPEEQEQEALDEEMIQEFENIINNLRAENELLNAAILDGEAVTGEQGALSEELESRVSTLQAQINELKLVNSDLSREITEYQQIIEESEPPQPDPEDIMPEDIDVDGFVEDLSENISEQDLFNDFNNLDGLNIIEETIEEPSEAVEEAPGEEVIENIEDLENELLITE